MRTSYLNRVTCTLLATCFGFAFVAPVSPGQDAPSPPASEAATAKAVTAGDSQIPTDHLKLLLLPLIKDQILVEAEAWRDLVKAKAQEIAQLEISLRTAGEGEADRRSQTIETLTQLREQKTALITRLNAVSDAYEKKGGDPGGFRQYADAVSVIDVNIKDVGATWGALTGWLTSKEGGLKWGANILKFLAIVFAFWLIAKFVSGSVRKGLAMNRRISHLLIQFINNVIGRIIMFIGLLVALATVGFNVGALLALIGGGAFILAFALQDTLANFAAGLMLLIYRPFDVGDAVEVGGINGKVDKVSLVSTTIRTFDNKVVLVPNKKVWGEIITNASASAERRVDLIFGIGYEDDIAQAQQIIERLVRDHELILSEPEPVIKVHELAESSVNFICRPWVKTPDYWTVYWDLTRSVKEEFDSAGISIPFPQRDVHIYSGDADEAGKKGPAKKTSLEGDQGDAETDTAGAAPNDG